MNPFEVVDLEPHEPRHKGTSAKRIWMLAVFSTLLSLVMFLALWLVIYRSLSIGREW